MKTSFFLLWEGLCTERLEHTDSWDKGKMSSAVLIMLSVHLKPSKEENRGSLEKKIKFIFLSRWLLGWARMVGLFLQPLVPSSCRERGVACSSVGLVDATATAQLGPNIGPCLILPNRGPWGPLCLRVAGVDLIWLRVARLSADILLRHK